MNLKGSTVECRVAKDSGRRVLIVRLRPVPNKEPRGSKYPIFEVSGSIKHSLHGIWDQRA